MEETLGILGAPRYKQTQQRLFTYLAGQRIHPAIILSGPDRESKLCVAKNIAKHLLCKKPQPGIPFCGHCSACSRAERGIHPDVFLESPEELSEPIKVESIRTLAHHMQLSPMEGGAKICIVDECHRMTRAAANAFLKALEEPAPNRYYWLLTSKVGSLLPTILSRCLQFNFRGEESELESLQSDTTAFNRFISDFRNKGLSTTITKHFASKDACMKFVRLVQLDIGHFIEGKEHSIEHLSIDDALDAFEEAVELEGRLRTNANFGLQVQSFIAEHLKSLHA